jgi:thiol-disulfide isomerase/thioredoxin
MQSEILSRLVWTGLIVLGGVGVYNAANYLLLRQNQDKESLIKGLKLGVPVVLYFTAPGCVPCLTVQKPALNRLRLRLKNAIQILEFDATEETELADHWGVLSVPTTFILDSRGRPRKVNRGVARFEKLIDQIEEVEKSNQSLDENRVVLE